MGSMIRCMRPQNNYSPSRAVWTFALGVVAMCPQWITIVGLEVTIAETIPWAI